MDHGSMVKQAWEITRGSRVLKGLSAITAAQLIVYRLVVVAMLWPTMVLPELTMSTPAGDSQATPAAPVLAFVPVIVGVLAGLALTALAVFLCAVFIAWLSSVWTILWLRLTSLAEQTALAVFGGTDGRGTVQGTIGTLVIER